VVIVAAMWGYSAGGGRTDVLPALDRPAGQLRDDWASEGGGAVADGAESRQTTNTKVSTADDVVKPQAIATGTSKPPAITPEPPAPTSPPGQATGVVAPTLLARIGDLAGELDDAAARWRSNALGSSDGLLQRGRSQAEAGRHAAAIECFDRALRKRPNDVPLLVAKAESLMALGDYAGAEALCAMLAAQCPDEASVHYNYGVLLYRQSRFTEAAEQFRRTVELEPNQARAVYNLATLAQRDGRLAEARAAWVNYTRLAPEVAAGWLHLGTVWMDFEQPVEAADCFSRAIALDGGDPDLHLNLALAHLALGEADAALEAMRQADRVSPCDAVVLSHLHDLHLALADSKPEEAATHRAQAADLAVQIEMLVGEAGIRGGLAGVSRDEP